MKRGVVLFAFDSDDVSYTDMAAWSAQRIHLHLDLPVSLITDKPCTGPSVFDQIFVVEAGTNGHKEGIPWKNLGRYRAYELSPYDQTLLLDVDYVVASDQLRSLFGSGQDILSMRMAYDATGRRDYLDLNWFGRHRMPSAWATVVYWRTSTAAEMIFDMMQMIQENWSHYKNIYQISEKKFRNDYALAIASNSVLGHLGHWPSIPWSMPTVESSCELSQQEADRFKIQYLDQQQRSRTIDLAGTDFHAMGKQQLSDIIYAG